MFSKKPVKITKISSAVSGEFLFTLGLGADNKVYMWNSTICDWVLHKAVVQPPQEQAS